MSYLRHPYVRHGAFPPEHRLNRYLDTVGNGSGTKNLNGNYGGSGNGIFARIQAPAGQVYAIRRMLVKIRDGTAGLSADNYGAIAAGLSTGIEVQVRESDETTVVQDLTDGVPVQINADWARLCYDARPDDYGNGDNFILIRWSFFRAGSPIFLTPGRMFGVSLSDDLSGLDAQFFLCQGFLIPLTS